MEKQNLQNKDIRRIGDKVLRAVRVSDDDIDLIVSSPDLFARIRTSGESFSEHKQTAAKPARVKKGLSALHTLRPRYMVYAAAVFVIMLMSVAVFRLTNNNEKPLDGNEIIVAAPETQTPIVESVNITTPAKPEIASASSKQARPKKRATRSAAVQRAQPPVKENDDMSEFQAVTYMGEASERLNTDRVVRVELSRASLFAMGVNVPVENESEKVKADLLIGDDGVMKGVRIERQ